MTQFMEIAPYDSWGDLLMVTSLTCKVLMSLSKIFISKFPTISMKMNGHD